jgi:CoA-transferase family III
MVNAMPLSGWADRQVRALAEATGSAALRSLSGAGLLAERAVIGGFRVPGSISAGGGCRFYETRGDPVALNLSRPDDRALLPALFGDADVDGSDESDILARFRASAPCGLVARGRELGLAIAALDEPPCKRSGQADEGTTLSDAKGTPLRVVDLSALWAGPLAARLLHLTGATVTKVESRTRPDAMRDGDPAFFDRLNNGKTHRALDLRDRSERDALIALICRSDVVIEAARLRALRQLGIDADALVDEVPSLVWATITGHGVAGEAANWVGFGDDTGVAGGLSAALRDATGKTGFVGDAIGDPLTGIDAARRIIAQRAKGQGARLILSMAGVVAGALAEERARDEAGVTRALEDWSAAEGQAFSPC